MKKTFLFSLLFALLVCLCACSSEDKQVEVKGAFQRENTITIVFDYSDYETPLPENMEEITLTVNGTVYNTAWNQASTSHNTGVTTKAFDCYERYYGYAYALGYGTVSQGTPKRMMAIFHGVEETGFESATFTLGEHVVSIDAAAFTPINTQSEIIKAEENYEEAYQVASFKWRIDSAYERAEGMDIFRKVPFGSDFRYLSEQIAYIFDGDVNWGVQITASTGIPFASSNGKWDEDVIDTNLPPFDVEVVKRLYPDAASQIDTIIDSTNTLAKDILNPKKSLDDFEVKGTRGRVKGAYSELCKVFDMDMIIATHS